MKRIIALFALLLAAVAVPVSHIEAAGRWNGTLDGPFDPVTGEYVEIPARGSTVELSVDVNPKAGPAYLGLTCTATFDELNDQILLVTAVNVDEPFFTLNWDNPSGTWAFCRVDLTVIRGNQAYIPDTLVFSVTP